MSTSSEYEFRRLQQLEDSNFFNRLDPILQGLVKPVTDEAAATLKRVGDKMPLYTLHDERHILNVLTWMEWLAEDVIDLLSPIECALSILAAYTHDLGMTITIDEERQLYESSDSSQAMAFKQFRDGYADEKQEIARLSKSELESDRYASQLLQQHLLMDFLRRTHADSRAERMRTRIGEIANTVGNKDIFTYCGINFREWLECIAISHNQDVTWLRNKLVETNDVFKTFNNRSANAVFVGLLLRQADIMDFDSSRTPKILFHHLGLDRELSSRFTNVSRQEWLKHLAITGISIFKTGSSWNVTYEAAQCEHPAIDKSIREYIGWIRHEITQCGVELQSLKQHFPGRADRYSFKLAEVKYDIKPKRIDRTPIYEYHDWQFRLDQPEIVRLLLGESLYGDPSLCIRELLQNSLDAVELRDLRLQLPKSDLRDPVDGYKIHDKEGYFIDSDSNERRLGVQLSWGRDDSEEVWWIKVEDNGVGMTRSVIEKFFTQLGRSFYRSAEFESEQALFRTKGLMAAPIAQFGIGILSCFMIADRVEIKTCPGGASEHRRPTDLTISGPGSLFWSKPGTRNEQGTEVKLILRRNRGTSSVELAHNPSEALRALRSCFGYGRPTTNDFTSKNVFDPALIAALHVIWPKYPVFITSDRGEKWCIDDSFHQCVLAPIDITSLYAKAEEWDIPLSQVRETQWCWFDWTDSLRGSDTDASRATGSRIRVLFARPNVWNVGDNAFEDVPERLKISDLASIIEPQLEDQVGGRSQVIVKGMKVDDAKSVRERLLLNSFTANVGARLWIDLRGELTPRLTVDRSRAIIPELEDVWTNAVEGMWDRFETAFIRELQGSPSRTRNALTILAPSKSRRLRIIDQVQPQTRSKLAFSAGSSLKDNLVAAQFATDLDLQRNISNLNRDYLPDNRLDPLRGVDRQLSKTNTRARSRARVLARTQALLLALHPEVDLARRRDRDSDRIQDKQASDKLAVEFPAWVDSYSIALLQNTFWPSLEESWPSIELFVFRGRIGDAFLISPGSFEIELESDGRKVAFSDPNGDKAGVLFDPEFGSDLGLKLEYDVCFPITSIPLSKLRCNCPEWRSNRAYAAVGTMPFLFPSYCNIWRLYPHIFREMFKQSQIHALFPPRYLWEKPFSAWTQADLSSREHLSFLWNIEKGSVHYAAGILTPQETESNGRLIGELLV